LELAVRRSVLRAGVIVDGLESSAGRRNLSLRPLLHIRDLNGR
jgi:hypothetical protein